MGKNVVTVDGQYVDVSATNSVQSDVAEMLKYYLVFGYTRNDMKANIRRLRLYSTFQP